MLSTATPVKSAGMATLAPPPSVEANQNGVAVMMTDFPVSIEEIVFSAIEARKAFLKIANKRLRSGKAANSFKRSPVFKRAYAQYHAQIAELVELLKSRDDDTVAAAHRGIMDVYCMWIISPDPTTIYGELESRVAHYR